MTTRSRVGPRTPHRLMRIWVAVGLVVGTMAGRAAAETSEASLKAAFLYNFALYTEWPTLGERFEICAIGKSGIDEALEVLTRKEIGGRPVRVQRVDSGPVPAACNLVFVPAPLAEHPGKLLAPLADKPVLTIVDGKPADGSQAMLQLAVDQGRLTFEANQTVARAAGLKFSAKLLRLARSVR